MPRVSQKSARELASEETLAADVAIEMVISDLNMPLVSGIDLFREMRAQGVNLPFILLTGDDPEGPRQQEPKLDACLLKDFSLEESLRKSSLKFSRIIRLQAINRPVSRPLP